MSFLTGIISFLNSLAESGGAAQTHSAPAALEYDPDPIVSAVPSLGSFVSSTPFERRKATDEDFLAAASRIGAEAATIKAVVSVESAGSGFDSSGRPKILFEPHIFNRETRGRYLGTKFEKDPSKLIASRSWNRANYPKTPDGVYAMLQQAMKLDRIAALRSASWGMMQVMGFNHKLCGYQTVEEFVYAMTIDEGKHIDAFVGFVVSNRLDDELRRKDWAGFAYGYNGSGYKANSYDTKMASAYAKASKVTVVSSNPRRYPIVGPEYNDGIRRLQIWLNGAVKPSPNLVTDGQYGKKTRLAMDAAYSQFVIDAVVGRLESEKLI
jgi:hypothetical protein